MNGIYNDDNKCSCDKTESFADGLDLQILDKDAATFEHIWAKNRLTYSNIKHMYLISANSSLMNILVYLSLKDFL